jgi:very-short-patch-repair endonuclease
MLKKHSTAKKIDHINVEPVLNNIIACQKEQEVIDKNSGLLIPLLGFMWQAGDCEWEKLIMICKTIIQLNREIIIVTGSAVKAKAWRDHISTELSEGATNFLAIHGKSMQLFTESWLLVYSLQRNITEVLGIDFSKLNILSGQYLVHLEMNAKQILDAIEQLKDWISWLNAKDKTIQSGLMPVVTAYESGEVKSMEVNSAYKKGLYRSCAEYIIQKEPALSLFNGKLFEEKIERFRRMSEYFEKLTKEELYAKLAAKIPDFTREASQTSEIGLLQKTIRNNGRAMPIRKLFDSISNLLPRIVPCMLMSPISVAQYFDASGPKFDLVVFDEASQMPTCEAVGAIARAKKVIVVGDPKQMPPTSFFSSNNVDEDNIDKEDLESILDDCLALSMPSRHLLWHYRSKHESLIAFSNSKYYENKLLTFPSPDDIATKVTSIPVSGYYDRGKTRQNSFEAKAVIEEIKYRLSDPMLSKRSIGVVTFSSVQQTLIQNLFDELLRLNPNLETVALDNPEPIFIKNLENVQGDERDVILFSVGYGPDKEGKVSLNFGPLNRVGGWRRLNVVVSRARYEMKVYSTLRSDQIDITRTASEGVAGVKAFLEYAEKGRVTLGIRKAGADVNESGFEQSLAEEIRKHGYEVHTNIGCSGYRIDIGIVNKEKPTEYILGILCDGKNYHAAKTAKDREIIQHEILRLLGWTVHKVWSTDWWENADRVLNSILEAIQDAIANKDKVIVEDEPGPEINLTPSTPEPMLFNYNVGLKETAAIEETPINTIYKICDLETVYTSSSDDFLQYYNVQKIKDQMQAVVEVEAPITRNLLARRVLAAWGIAKMGTRINAQFEHILAQSNLSRTVNGDIIVFWNANINPESYTGYRIETTDGKKRDADDLPPEEIANAVKEILSHQISLPKEDLIREASRLFGFARSGTNVEMAMRKGIDFAIKKNFVLESNGRVVNSEN